ncbi:MAG TPA: helix-turn-helix domain-containing protein [Streptomyces sp.]|nr:helix-turn-helix domain-containing protein [Streptomyces sp.]
MRELAGRLAALDPDVGAALRVIAYFDRLLEDRAGVEALVRGAAVLSGCPARLVDEERGVRVRVDPDGRRSDFAGPADPAWPCAPLVPAGSTDTQPPDTGTAPMGSEDVRQTPAALWLEHPGSHNGVHAMVLERAAAAVRLVLDRTRGRAPVGAPADDPALVEVLLDASAPRSARMSAATRLGLDTSRQVRAVAPYGGGPQIEAVVDPGGRTPHGRRAGIGPAVEWERLPESWSAARTALRLTAEGTAQDPGPRTVYAEELGGLALLADAVGPDTPPIPDVRAVERAVAEAPWVAATLHAVAFAPSLRAAATVLTVHHSTLQERLAQAEHTLGWEVRSPQGRLRLQLALTISKLRWR